MSTRLTLFFPATGTFILLFNPPVLVGTFIDFEFNRVVTSGDRCDIPVKLGDLTALVERADHNGEEEGNSDGGGHGEAHLVVLHITVLKRLDARVLNKEAALTFNVAVIGLFLRLVNTSDSAVVYKLGGFADGGCLEAEETGAVGLAMLDFIVVRTVSQHVVTEVDTVFVDLTDGAVRALQGEFADLERN